MPGASQRSINIPYNVAHCIILLLFEESIPSPLRERDRVRVRTIINSTLLVWVSAELVSILSPLVGES